MSYTQPQLSMHSSLMTNTKYFASWMGYFISPTLLQLSLLCNVTDQPTYTHDGTGTEPFMDAEVFNLAYDAFIEGKQIQSEWTAAARTGNYVAYTLAGINYALPAFSDVPESVMPTKSAKILLGVTEAGIHVGWRQNSYVLSASRNAAAVQHGCTLILSDVTAPVVLRDLAQRALTFASKVRNITGYSTSIEDIVVARAGL
jgi:hypothetical protein